MYSYYESIFGSFANYFAPTLDKYLRQATYVHIDGSDFQRTSMMREDLPMIFYETSFAAAVVKLVFPE